VVVLEMLTCRDSGLTRCCGLYKDLSHHPLAELEAAAKDDPEAGWPRGFGAALQTPRSCRTCAIVRAERPPSSARLRPYMGAAMESLRSTQSRSQRRLTSAGRFRRGCVARRPIFSIRGEALIRRGARAANAGGDCWSIDRRRALRRGLLFATGSARASRRTSGLAADKRRRLEKDGAAKGRHGSAPRRRQLPRSRIALHRTEKLARGKRRNRAAHKREAAGSLNEKNLREIRMPYGHVADGTGTGNDGQGHAPQRGFSSFRRRALFQSPPLTARGLSVERNRGSNIAKSIGLTRLIRGELRILKDRKPISC